MWDKVVYADYSFILQVQFQDIFVCQEQKDY